MSTANGRASLGTALHLVSTEHIALPDKGRTQHMSGCDVPIMQTHEGTRFPALLKELILRALKYGDLLDYPHFAWVCVPCKGASVARLT